MRYRFLTADVFTERVFGGNPLAVLLGAEGLDAARMQAVAREFNYSETVFLGPAEAAAHAARVRIFTPAAEIPFAGHPTIGTAWVLAAIGAVATPEGESRIVLEERVGPVAVTLRVRGGVLREAELTAAQRPEFRTGAPPPERLAELLSVDVADLHESAEPTFVSCGIPFLFIELASEDAVRRAAPRQDRWSELLGGAWSEAVFVYARGRPKTATGADVHARMFAPSFGVPEDPATGSAATALAALLAVRESVGEGRHTWHIAQGVEMGRPSSLRARALVRHGDVLETGVAGSAVLVSEGRMKVP